MTWYHGTSQDIWEKIRADGINFEAPRRGDPGDFGWGLYLTREPARARTYGERIIEVTLGGRFAYIPNPYFRVGFEKLEPETDIERLFHSLVFEGDRMLTVNGTRESRDAAAKRIRDTFMARGYLGIITLYGGEEAVAFCQEGVTELGGLR